MKNIPLSTICLLLVPLSLTSCRNVISNKVQRNTISSQLITDDSLLDLTERRTFRYFWDGAEPVSGMARERIHIDGNYPENDFNVVTTGGSGFGIMAIIAGIDRGYISKQAGVARLRQIVDFPGKADRFHGAWPHWLYGETGKVKPFSPKDNGGDLVETAYLVQGLLTARQYFNNGNEAERSLAADINKLWKDVEWDFYTRVGKPVIYWHWSPDHDWQMNFPVEGYNECLLLYVLASSSESHPVSPAAYHKAWARNGAIKSDQVTYGMPLFLKHNYAETYGGPLFWAHYSYLGLDPRGLTDKYADYWKMNVDQALINHKWCQENPNGFKGYSSDRWGLTASYSAKGYAAHAPGKKSDLGVISPTAALSSFPYTPVESMVALRDFYYKMGDKIFNICGFYDAFSEQNDWFPKRYLAIDQGPIAVMIENYRSGLLWKLFMSCPEIKSGLKRLGFTSISVNNQK